MSAYYCMQHKLQTKSMLDNTCDVATWKANAQITHIQFHKVKIQLSVLSLDPMRYIDNGFFMPNQPEPPSHEIKKS